jgi:SAM-dependent MidA family methyltransferase
MPWREWMEAALYDPREGYYTTNIRSVGRRGDFSTSATLGGALARAVAVWVREEWGRAGRKLPLIEIGPGDGSLQRNVWKALGWTGRMGLRGHLVERSPVLRGLQEEKLRSVRRRLTWHGSMESALDACEGSAVIFSNEVADAFPATLLQYHDGNWREVWLCISESGGIVEELRDCPPEVQSFAMKLKCGEGQRVEVLYSWREWLRGWRPHWHSGAMLTVDYGGTAEEIYHRRPGGTVRGYFHHQTVAAGELYALTGRCDVTADVNFTDLREWGEGAGLITSECVDQRAFVNCRTALSDAVHGDGGAAEAFRCLVQRPVSSSG